MVKEIHKLSCPFCGTNRSVTPEFSLKPLHILPSEYGVISVREVQPGPGRGRKGGGGGFPNVRRINIVEMLNSPEYEDLAKQIIERFESIWRSYKLAGILIEDSIYFRPAP